MNVVPRPAVRVTSPSSCSTRVVTNCSPKDVVLRKSVPAGNPAPSSATVSTVALPSGWRLVSGYFAGPGADLQTADLAGAGLAGMDLTGADLGGTVLTGADLSGTVLTGAELLGTVLTGADLTGVRSGGVTGTPASLPSGWSLAGGYVVGPEADLVGADLRNAPMAGTDLDGADLAGAVLTGVTSGGVTGSPAELPAGWQLTAGYLIGPGADLSGAALGGADLAGADLAGTDLSGSDLTGVHSGGAYGTPASLPGQWALVGGYLIGPWADLAGADLDGLDLRSTALYGVVSGGVSGSGTLLPPGWLLRAGHLIGPGVDLTGVDLAGTDLAGVSSGGVTGTPTALPAGWQLTAGYLIGPGADLSHATLAGAALAGADLAGADLSWAFLGDADLAGADLTGADLTEADALGADLSGSGVTGVTWSATVCPDGTISDDVGGTCLADLSPLTDSDGSSQLELRRALGDVTALAARYPGALASYYPGALAADTAVVYTSGASHHSVAVSIDVSADANGVVLASDANDGHCWYVGYNVGVVTDPFSPYAPFGAPTAVGTFYGEGPVTSGSDGCAASDPVGATWASGTFPA